MQDVRDIFAKGPDGVIAFCAQQEMRPSFDDLSMKQLSDICWTRANSLRSQPELARRWALAAFRVFEWLSRHASELVAQSAQENCTLLRPWALQQG
jgi:hypothetical protein